MTGVNDQLAPKYDENFPRDRSSILKGINYTAYYITINTTKSR